MANAWRLTRETLSGPPRRVGIQGMSDGEVGGQDNFSFVSTPPAVLADTHGEDDRDCVKAMGYIRKIDA